MPGSAELRAINLFSNFCLANAKGSADYGYNLPREQPARAARGPALVPSAAGGYDGAGWLGGPAGPLEVVGGGVSVDDALKIVGSAQALAVCLLLAIVGGIRGYWWTAAAYKAMCDQYERRLAEEQQRSAEWKVLALQGTELAHRALTSALQIQDAKARQ